MISFSSDNEFFKGKTETFPVMRIFLELTQHTPPKGCQYIRRYGLYASRTKDPVGFFKGELLHLPQEVRKILRHLVKIGRSPPGFDPTSLN